MPETGAAFGEIFADFGAADAAGGAAAVGEAGAGEAAIGAGAATTADGAAGAAADFGAGTYAAGDVAAGAAAGGASSADLAAMYGTEGYGAAASPAELAAGGAGAGATSAWDSISQMFSKSGTIGQALKTGGQGLGLVQVLSGLYGLNQSQKLSKQAQGPGMTAAGLQAVMRGMAAQGYQGSGNMMTALEQYGAQTNVGNPAAAQGALSGQLSSLGLLTGGLPMLAGWGPAPSPAPKP